MTYELEFNNAVREKKKQAREKAGGGLALGVGWGGIVY